MGTKIQDYRDAQLSQGAVNLGALIYSLPKLVDRIWEDARAQGKGTDYVNGHPTLRLFLEQMYFLSQSEIEYTEAAALVRGVVEGRIDPATLLPIEDR